MVSYDIEVQVWIQDKRRKMFWVYNNKTEKIKELLLLPDKVSSFQMLKYSKVYKKYDTEIKKMITNQDKKGLKKILKKYMKEIFDNRQQFLDYKYINFDILQTIDGKPRGLNILPKNFFEYLCKKRVWKYGRISHEEPYKYTEILDRINTTEFHWFQNHYNGGKQFYCKGKEPGIFKNCYGYDFKNCYASVLGNTSNTLNLNGKNYKFLFPEKEGELKTINELPKFLDYGLYKVKIISQNQNFNKYFTFNNKNIYTHYEIQIARDCIIQLHMKDIDIQLLSEDNNFLSYHSRTTTSHTVFSKWFEKISEMKKEMKGNTLLKFMSSSLWGSLSKLNKVILNEDEMFGDIDYDYEIMDMFQKNGDNYYKIIPLKNNSNIYNTNFRLKPFITAFVRCKMMKIIMDYNLWSNVIRIHTDGIILDKQVNFTKNDKELIPEEKSTGDFQFDNVNDYSRI